MAEKSEKRPATITKKISVGILILVNAAIVLSAVAFCYLALRPDSPAFDDSALAAAAPQAPKDPYQNGYEYLKYVVEKKGDWQKTYFEEFDLVKAPGNLTAAEAAKMDSTYGADIAAVEKALAIKQFAAPVYKVFPDDYMESHGQHDEVAVLLFLRKLSWLNSCLARRNLSSGDYESAGRRILDNLRLGNRVMADGGGTMHFMFGQSMVRRQMSELDKMLGAKLITRKLIMAVLAELKNERALIQQCARNTAALEYSSVKGHYAFMETNRARLKPQQRISLKLVYRRNKMLETNFEFFKSIADNADKPYNRMKVPDDDYFIAGYGGGLSRLKFLLKAAGVYDGAAQLTAISFDNYRKALIDDTVVFESECELFRAKAAAAMSRALNGRPPETLLSLVPAYFDTVPADPFDGAPVRYDGNKGILYSVGFNLKDDGGAAVMSVFQPKASPDALAKEKDIVLILAGN